MTKLIYLDDGHGQNTSGKRTPTIAGTGVILENTFNRAVVKYLGAALTRCGLKVGYTAPGDDDPSLTTRCNRANAAGADLFISCHYNAGGGSGVETYYYNGLSSTSNSARLAKAVHAQLLHSDILKQKDRGVKSANFAVVRQTAMPAILIEYGFMDDPGYIEAKLMTNAAWQKERAEQTAKGICSYLGVTYKPETSAPPSIPSNPWVFYDCVIDGANVATFSARNPEEIAEKVLALVKAHKKEIKLNMRES